MTDGESKKSRRRFLRLTGGGSIVGLAGCLSTPSNPIESHAWNEGGGDDGDDSADDWCLEDLSDTVPEVERTAVSIDGLPRKDPEELITKEQAGYKCGPSEGMQCGNCRFYIDDRNGNAYGACTEIEGEVRSVDWCALWQKREKALGPADPESR